MEYYLNEKKKWIKIQGLPVPEDPVSLISIKPSNTMGFVSGLDYYPLQFEG